MLKIKKILFLIFIALVIFFISFASLVKKKTFLPVSNQSSSWWEVQSIDTMKYSRDLAREKLNDPGFDAIIDEQVKNISQTGATHVAIATPYDEEFLPYLWRWVAAARKYKLNVWFRGNWSGWEQWFGYTGISREEHNQKTQEFILQNKSLFADGDIFTPCPEAENGGPGDPRITGDVNGHRRFLIQEYQVTQKAFAKIGKKVRSNFNSMNGDVARLIMDKETTKALDGVVVIDHYVSTPKILAKDIKDMASQSSGKVVLGEFGAPIGDIHGAMSEQEQAQWLNEALEEVTKIPQVIGLNYWTNMGSSTRLWESDGKARKAVGILYSFYTPQALSGTVKNQLDQPVSGAKISSFPGNTVTDGQGKFKLSYRISKPELEVEAEGFVGQKVRLDESFSEVEIILVKEHEGFFFKIRKFLQ